MLLIEDITFPLNGLKFKYKENLGTLETTINEKYVTHFIRCLLNYFHMSLYGNNMPS